MNLVVVKGAGWTALEKEALYLSAQHEGYGEWQCEHVALCLCDVL